MIAPRRFLPSTGALMAFEAVARLGSATAAAQELSLTQSGVSRQLRSLETQIGAALVQREGRALVLTPVGREYARTVREILHRLAAASVAARTNPDGGTLNLAILPAFGMHWLAPRLQDFARTHPEVTVNLSTRLAPFDFRASRFDAAIHFGRADWPRADHLPLMPETVVPVCAPGLLQQASSAQIAAQPAASGNAPQGLGALAGGARLDRGIGRRNAVRPILDHGTGGDPRHGSCIAADLCRPALSRQRPTCTRLGADIAKHRDLLPCVAVRTRHPGVAAVLSRVAG